MRTAPQFVDFPASIPASVYDDAVSRYARAVAPRAIAVYQNGRVRHPGLSDIDLLVVVDRARWDNDQFFSPQARLPHVYHRLFRHRPHFVTLASIDALAFTTFAYRPRDERSSDDTPAVDRGAGFRRRLVGGTDILPAAWSALPDAWYVCALLEAATSFQTTLKRYCTRDRLSASKLASMATTFRYPIRQLDELAGTSFEPPYSESIDRARCELLDPSTDRVRVAGRTFVRFVRALEAFDERLAALLRLPSRDHLRAAARDALLGRITLTKLDPTYLDRRRRAIDAYFKELRRVRISGLPIFTAEPYHGTIPRYHPEPPARLAAVFSRSFERVRRLSSARLFGHAGPLAIR